MLRASAIWMPRYWDKTILIDRKAVRSGKNYLFFCCDKKYPDLYSYDGSRVLSECKITTNGKIYCYQVPLDWLTNEGDLPEQFIPERDKELSKYQKTLKKNKK